MPTTSYRYLANLPNVCGGKTIVEGTRVGVHDVVSLIVNGATVDEVLRSFPSGIDGSGLGKFDPVRVDGGRDLSEVRSPRRCMT